MININKINFKGIKKITYQEAEDVGQIIIKLFNESQFDVCTIFYNKFKNVITQIPQEQQIIPIEKTKDDGKKIESDQNDYNSASKKHKRAVSEFEKESRGTSVEELMVSFRDKMGTKSRKEQMIKQSEEGKNVRCDVQ